MGEQVSESIEARLFYVPKNEFDKILGLPIDPVKKVEIFSDLCRINVLYMIARAGSGHIGSSFSSIEMMSWLQINEVSNTSLFFSSKGHDAPALYSTLMGVGKLDFGLIHKFRKAGGLPGHPDINTPNIITNTGSLGMGISKAKGIIFANRLRKNVIRVTVLLGDGELQEGQIWESLLSAANSEMFELTVIIDHNKLQSDTTVAETSDLGRLEEKFKSFGFKVFRCDGNNVKSFSETYLKSKLEAKFPQIIIADTIKGKGVSFIEHKNTDSDTELYRFHSGAPSEENYRKALNELKSKIELNYNKNNIPSLNLQNMNYITKKVDLAETRLINFYADYIVEFASKNDNIVALDADLILDTGLVEFKRLFPHRFLECGIAEQDMVSQAGGLALSGFLPIVHSFASFLSSRSNEQIYNNSTEAKKIIYVGSLAGVLPGGPGHSHQAVRDIATLCGIPNLDIIEPSNPEELKMALDWAINHSNNSTYLRLVSVPYPINKGIIKKHALVRGQGTRLLEGEKIAIISYGPIILSILMEVAEEIIRTKNFYVRLVNLPWLNVIDESWVLNELTNIQHLITIDNHMIQGGQGEKVAAIIGRNKTTVQSVEHIGLKNIPPFGTNSEVLNALELEKEQLVKKILEKLI